MKRIPVLRDDTWLYQLLDDVWDKHFSDVPQDNTVKIVWGRRTKNRLGSIKVDPRDPHTTIITLNGLFKEPEVPTYVIVATLVHELSHYAHGFNSPLPQKYRQPHAGGVMKSEFAERGLGELYTQQRRWLRQYWHIVVESKLPKHTIQRKKVVKKTISIPRPFWMLGS